MVIESSIHLILLILPRRDHTKAENLICHLEHFEYRKHKVHRILFILGDIVWCFIQWVLPKYIYKGARLSMLSGSGGVYTASWSTVRSVGWVYVHVHVCVCVCTLNREWVLNGGFSAHLAHPKIPDQVRMMFFRQLARVESSISSYKVLAVDWRLGKQFILLLSKLLMVDQ